jgi:hypothetical protein
MGRVLDARARLVAPLRGGTAQRSARWTVTSIDARLVWSVVFDDQSGATEIAAGSAA